MKSDPHPYFGKILLFGEYSIICGSKGLVVPYKNASAQWEFAVENNKKDEFVSQSFQSLFSFHKFLLSQPQLAKLLNLDAFAAELSQGMFFNSNIPQGYGVGSSGALVAAVFNRYSLKSLPEEATTLRIIFGLAESFFHGNSSGIDPLACYLNESLLIMPNGEINRIENPLEKTDKSKFAVFLIDTHTTGITGPLVNHFQTRLLEYKFFRQLRDQYIPATNHCIDSIIKQDIEGVMTSLKHISVFQKTEMTKMIPADFLTFFGASIAEQPFTLKLCGSGGGGYMLGFTVDAEKTQQLLTHKNIPFIWLN